MHPKRSWLRRIQDGVKKLLTEESSPGRLALAFGVGAFVGPTPTVGLHTVSAIGLAWLFRVNKVVAVVGSNIANPWTMAFWLWLDVRVGAWMMGRELPPFPRQATLDELTAWLEPRIVPAFLGCIPVGLGAAALSGAIVYVIAKAWELRGGAAAVDETSAD